jgi:serine/threonine protein kinase
MSTLVYREYRVELSTLPAQPPMLIFSPTRRADIWAFGCVLFQIIAGRPPFRGATEYLTFQKVLACEYDFPEGFDAAAKSLIERILVGR